MTERRFEMETIGEKGAETVAAVAGGRAATSAVQGRFKKALVWTIPVALAGVVIWYIRKR
jgi:hypothetical protein